MKEKSCPSRGTKPEQIVTMLRQIEVSIANGRSTPQAWGRISSTLPSSECRHDDFGDEMSEREVIEVCNSACIINGAMHKVYLAKLDERNSAAHPSTNHVTQVQAEGFIDNLIRNTVLLLKI
jgi:hypothetical protein